MCNDLLIFAPSILMKLAQFSFEVRITNYSGRNEPNVFQRFEPSWPVSIHVLALKGGFFEVMFVGLQSPVQNNFNELGFLEVLQCSDPPFYVNCAILCWQYRRLGLLKSTCLRLEFLFCLVTNHRTIASS